MSEFLDEFFCTIFGAPNFCSHFSDALKFETLDTFQSGFYTASFRIEVALILFSCVLDLTTKRYRYKKCVYFTSSKRGHTVVIK